MNLSTAQRMNLMKFVCSFAWTDLKVTQLERDLVMRIVGRLSLTEGEAKQIAAWLDVPPDGDEIDPTEVPLAHRQLFYTLAEMVVKSDGLVSAERDALAVFRDLLDA
jgi:hypothetical protein